VEPAALRGRTRVHRVPARQTTTGVARAQVQQIITVQQQEMIVGWRHDPELRITVREPKTTAGSRAQVPRKTTTIPPRRVLVIQTIVDREREMIVEWRRDPAYRIIVREPKTIVESPAPVRRTITIIPMRRALELQKISQGRGTTVEFRGRALPKTTAI
jgi:hypothetical protein